jgi:glycine cleavage system H protein
MNYPKELNYTTTDEWVKVEGDLATIGISDHAQDQLSDIVFLEISVDPGDEIGKGDVIAVVESVKAASDIYSPLSGTVDGINEALRDTPEVINSDPYGNAWILRLKLANPTELEGLLDVDRYVADIEEREG